MNCLNMNHEKDKTMDSVIENNKRTKTLMLGLYVLERLEGKAHFQKLMCLLYLAERKHLVKYGIPMMPYQFVALGYFPCIEGINDMFFWRVGDAEVVINGTPSLEYVKETLDMDWLSQSEAECIDELIKECKGDSDETLIEKCWIKAGPETFEKNGMLAVIPKALIAEEGGASTDLVEYIKEQLLVDKALDT